MENATTIPQSVYVGEQDLTDKELEFFAHVFFKHLENMTSGDLRKTTYHSTEVEILEIRKLCRVMEDGDARHPGYWPMRESEVYRQVHRDRNDTFHYSNAVPITINGVTLPPLYAEWVFNVFYRERVRIHYRYMIEGTAMTMEELFAMSDKFYLAKY